MTGEKKVVDWERVDEVLREHFESKVRAEETAVVIQPFIEEIDRLQGALKALWEYETGLSLHSWDEIEQLVRAALRLQGAPK